MADAELQTFTSVMDALVRISVSTVYLGLGLYVIALLLSAFFICIILVDNDARVFCLSVLRLLALKAIKGSTSPTGHCARESLT